MAHLFLHLDRTRLRLVLLDHHVAQAALHFVEMTQGQRRCHGRQQAVDLPLEPVVVDAEFADVLDDQVQQFEQRLLDLDLLLGRE